MISIQFFKTSFGELILGCYGTQLCICDWRYRKMRSAIDKRIQQGLGCRYVEEDTEVIRKARGQLEEYMDGKRMVFDLPLRLVGSDFQVKVWEELLNIPYGKTETYIGLATRVGNPLSVRAVAAANGANALSIMVPCHRVVGSRGELTGYAGGLSTKKKLIQFEKHNSGIPEWMLFP